METAPTLIFYAYTGKSEIGEDRWTDRTLPDYFYEDKDAARRDMLGLHAQLEADHANSYPPLCLERIETVPMTRSAIMALLNDGVGAIIGSYQVIEEIDVKHR
ncbi:MULTISPECIES: hypothetical protein [Shinella]|uniref:Uncharacterized protein n=1 Tax=Shinella zoogloeoides TaxID=352475 RepID=A0A6N8THE6_SHIZO|nr:MULTISPECIES: hypothetical protein [Shinella]EYR79570.1 hypothetical protein SHLA_130c000070 [Shinella sp. DD12]MCW5712154.1 hypothetical protein [Shinella sp.]MXO01855.1 hypothetical protein [Shinella zoogloeoides]TAA49286.1 hypothetical protein EXZ48_34440 [Shinella sp. JR1-6]UEX84442.1 hypothetical protein K8M09_23390 [Shinella zoogloeoides]